MTTAMRSSKLFTRGLLSRGLSLSCAARILLRTPSRSAQLSTAAAPVRKLGQPTHETHPHLLKAGEVTPGITAIEYALRRSQLAASLPEGGIAVIPSSIIKYRSGPVFYEFHQDPDFFYLTGFLEPESVAVIEKTGPEGEHTFHLFVRGKEAHAELWEGSRTGIEGAMEVFNADKAYDVDHLQYHISPIIQAAKTVYVDVPSQSQSQHTVFFGATKGTTLISALEGKRTQPLKPAMHRLRITKSGAEATVMRKAGKMSGRAYNKAMAQDFLTEKDLASYLEYEFKAGGCDGSAYVPVVAGGENALTIHYTNNNNILRDGDLVLVDAGGHYGGYVTDITRTWPVSGRFTAAQKDLYNAVLTVQRNCVKLCRADAGLSLDEIHHVAEDGLRQELLRLGFDLSGNALGNVLFPHHVGHYVGVDLHDCGTYGRRAPLTAGQVITVEPGVYVPNNSRWPKHFRGMGIRIEDSVYVGEENPIVLSVEAVKEVDDIEALREE
ncbi:peptidase M24, structural domain-containing protein [Tricharina praecox]|uniref:peptidase M24, structural domain-containing protein n=1 Tax=Tricharina praecox TaxID=43433 RepID=UPI00221EE80A|nr:peptidase M24, structural domain-containing protein [Tricharina praecox]KAI5849826.1 peptidase M24, structural domain-containing protein [Tricharina praecox]